MNIDNPIASEHYKVVINILSSLPKGAKVLDVGCGPGILSEKLNKIGLNVFACDIDKKVSKNNKILFKHADLNKKIPYIDNFFEAVVCLGWVSSLERNDGTAFQWQTHEGRPV